jgi:hypothetical protein
MEITAGNCIYFTRLVFFYESTSSYDYSAAPVMYYAEYWGYWDFVSDYNGLLGEQVDIPSVTIAWDVSKNSIFQDYGIEPEFDDN